MVDKERMSAIASTVAISLRMERDRASCGMVEKEKVARYRHHGSKGFSHGVSLCLPMSCEHAWIASDHCVPYIAECVYI